LDVLNEGVGGEVVEEGGEVEGVRAALGVLATALTITTAASSTATAVAASIWWRVVVGLRLLVLIWSDLSWVRSVRVSHHSIGRAWLLLLLDLLGVVGGSGGSRLLGRLSVVRLLSL
jgi:hypothetical protein